MSEIDPARNTACRIDGQVSDPHFYPLWQTVPGVCAGASDPPDLIEIIS